MNIVVFGAGLVGSAIIGDLKENGHKVTAVDINAVALERVRIKHAVFCLEADFSKPDVIADIMKDQDMAVGAAPGDLGYSLMEQVIRNGKNMVDISFCPQDFLELDPLAKEHGVTVIADMGVAPGMCNAILGFSNSQMDVKAYKCIVGGLPVERTWPLEYKSSWSPIDCIEEYVRPARIMKNGRVVTLPALSEPELVEFEGIGTLEEWNSDGLRSLLKTMSHIPDMVEKTLRYPGTIQFLKALRELGYFSYEEIDVKGKKVRPVDLTASLLFPKWKLEKGEEEFTVMRVTVRGEINGAEKVVQYDLFDKYHPETDTLSMSRTTGYTCSATAELLLNKKIGEKGVLAPEHVGANKDNFNFILNYLKERGVVYKISGRG